MTEPASFTPDGDGFLGRITGALTVDKISALQARAQRYFFRTPALWAVIDLSDAVPLSGADRDEHEMQVDNVNRVARNLMVVRRDEFRLAIIGDKRDFDELITLMAEAQTMVGNQLPGRKIAVERFDDPDLAYAWARNRDE
ncbi:MAG: hypothetical protein AAGC53_18020 [Actinomycetota bacterium]